METLSALLAICAGNSPVPGEFPAQRPVTRSFDVFFDLRLNERLSKQSWGWWFETLSRPLWRYCYEMFTCIILIFSIFNVHLNRVYANEYAHDSVLLSFVVVSYVNWTISTNTILSYFFVT